MRSFRGEVKFPTSKYILWLFDQAISDVDMFTKEIAVLCCAALLCDG